MTSRVLVYSCLLLIGAGLAIAGGLVQMEDALKAISGVSMGIGAGLFGMSAAQLILLLFLARRPEARQRVDIEARDERNALLNRMAKARAFTVVQVACAPLILTFVLLDESLLTVLLLIGVYLIGWGTYFVSLNRYSKAM
jgi:hypothetical protein